MKFDIKNLTLDEKIELLSGRNFWMLKNANGKLPDIFLADGPHGLRMMDITTNQTKIATAMPTLSVLANTWNRDLAYLDATTIADECLIEGADVLLAPGVNIKRTPLCGRNFEYFSEDPYLAGELAKSFINGVQDKGIGTSLKHLCANNREYDRFNQSSDLDERTLREIYLPAFEIALEAKPWTVMCSYNPINGIWTSENKWILQDVLRDEFGFDGLIVSDWHAVHNSWRAVKAGINLEMPYRPESVEEIKKAYLNGWITEEEIDARVQKVLEFMEKCVTCKKVSTTTKEQRHEIAVEIAREGIVLLKNQDDILPLKGGKIMTCGPFVNAPQYGGGGSALVISSYVPKPLNEELSARLGDKASVTVSNFGLTTDKNFLTNIRRGVIDAYNADTVVICVGNNDVVERETYDRPSLKLSQNQEDMIINIASANPNVVVVLNVGSAVDMSAWLHLVKGVVLLGFAGEGGQEALADILTGKICPSGKLSETYPLTLEDTPCKDIRGNGFYEEYKEGVFVGYRWYEKTNSKVAFPFGHGLSYAKFDYSDMEIEKITETDYNVSFNITNNSKQTAKEIAQIYVKDVFAMVPRPQKELKGFVKVELLAGESKRVNIKLNARSFAYYSTPLKKWYVENGDFEILVGASSQDIRLTKKLTISLPENEQYTWLI